MRNLLSFSCGGVLTGLLLVLCSVVGCKPSSDAQITNVSYDPTRELYKEVNTALKKLEGPDGENLNDQSSS